MECDDELSNQYAMKDTNKFRISWNRRFFKRTRNPTNVNGFSQDDEIADVFL